MVMNDFISGLLIPCPLRDVWLGRENGNMVCRFLFTDEQTVEIRIGDAGQAWRLMTAEVYVDENYVGESYMDSEEGDRPKPEVLAIVQGKKVENIKYSTDWYEASMNMMVSFEGGVRVEVYVTADHDSERKIEYLYNGMVTNILDLNHIPRLFEAPRQGTFLRECRRCNRV